MNDHKKSSSEDTMREEYDFSNGVRGKYTSRYAEGSNVVVLDPDVAAAYPTAEAANEALREAARSKRQRESL